MVGGRGKAPRKPRELAKSGCREGQRDMNVLHGVPATGRLPRRAGNPAMPGAWEKGAHMWPGEGSRASLGITGDFC